MKSGTVSGGILLLLSFLILSCNDKITEPSDEITAKPVVKKTAVNYSEQSFNTSFPDTATLNSISEAYTNHYSVELRGKILDYMKGEVERFGEDVDNFDSILRQTGCKDQDSYILPTYAEKAQYENRDVWVLQITYGLNSPTFGHCKCYVFDAVTLDALTYKWCR